MGPECVLTFRLCVSDVTNNFMRLSQKTQTRWYTAGLLKIGFWGHVSASSFNRITHRSPKSTNCFSSLSSYFIYWLFFERFSFVHWIINTARLESVAFTMSSFFCVHYLCCGFSFIFPLLFCNPSLMCLVSRNTSCLCSLSFFPSNCDFLSPDWSY